MKFSEALNEWYEINKQLDGDIWSPGYYKNLSARKLELEEFMDNIIQIFEDDHH